MIKILLYVLIGLIIGGCGVYLLLKSRLEENVERNIETEQLNQQIKEENLKLTQEREKVKNLLAETTYDYRMIEAKKNELKNSMEELRETQEKAAKDIYDQALEIAATHYDEAIDNISKNLAASREEASREYLATLQESVGEYQAAIAAEKLKLNELTTQIIIEQRNVDAAVEAAKRQKEIDEKTDFYRLVLSDEDINEIKKLREVLPYLRDKEPLNKVIYKSYYEKPYTDLIGRVVGPGIHTGIYKITNLLDNMCYVGQAANIAERWRQHIKRGVGAETPTRNKLYPAMMAIGVENFTFEIIEECPREKLDEREDYWQDYFHAKDYGYSIK